MKEQQHSGKVYKVNGPIIEAIIFEDLMMLEVVYVGPKKIIGEVIKLYRDKCIIQVYEDTTMIKPDDFVYRTNNLLNVILGPGLLSSIFDGIQRPLTFLFNNSKQPFISAGEKLFPLNTDKLWHFKPIIKNNSFVKSGEIIGVVDETEKIQHKIMVPNFLEGEIINIKSEGNYKITDTIAQLKTKTKIVDLKLYQQWSVRSPRPYLKKDNEIEPLLTGQRVIDTLFPVKKGGVVMIPGGFGTGKTMTQQAIAKWCNADIIVYIGCGERGNEMADVLKEFEHLFDYKNNKPLIERTIIIANTSNMPVAARETSIYTGITIAEYYRDMGYDVALMADSTSRWAEALRELSARMEEIPAEESYPAYLASYLAKFYERAGKVVNLNSTKGSITIIGAVSPQGGDFSEPVTQQTKRFTKVFWALDKQLANERHYPAINWINSYSEYADEIVNWYNKHINDEFGKLRQEIINILAENEKLQQVVKLVGADVLPDNQRLIIETVDLFKNIFLQQNAYDAIDMYSVIRKQFLMLKIIIRYYEKAKLFINQGHTLLEVKRLPVYNTILKMKFSISNNELEKFENIILEIDKQISV